MQQPSEPHSAAPEFTMSPLRVQTLCGFTYLHATTRTTMETLFEDIEALMGKVGAARAQGAGVNEPHIFAYFMEAQTGPFVMKIGVMCPPGTDPAGEAQVADLGDFRCATMLYSGALAHIGRAWGELMKAAGEAGLKTGPESREYYLYFEAEDSLNNVALLAASLIE